VGRTLQMWNTFHASPWLLRFFDQIRFHEVSALELLEIRADFPYGGYPLRIEERIPPQDYHAFLNLSAASAGVPTDTRAFEASGTLGLPARTSSSRLQRTARARATVGCDPGRLPRGLFAGDRQRLEHSGEAGQRVQAGQKLMVLEAMKMEIAVSAPSAGTVEMVDCAPGALVNAGQRLVTLRQEV
jgi:urea carboxylase